MKKITTTVQKYFASKTLLCSNIHKCTGLYMVQFQMRATKLGMPHRCFVLRFAECHLAKHIFTEYCLPMYIIKGFQTKYDAY